MEIIQKVNYIDTSGLDKTGSDAINELLEDQNHNNGHAFYFQIEPLENAGYPKLTQWLMDQGLRPGDFVIIHSRW